MTVFAKRLGCIPVVWPRVYIDVGAKQNWYIVGYSALHTQTGNPIFSQEEVISCNRLSFGEEKEALRSGTTTRSDVTMDIHLSMFQPLPVLQTFG